MKAATMRAIAQERNRKKHRSAVLRQYRAIKKAVRKTAEKGEHWADWHVRQDGFTFPYSVVAARLFKFRYRDFKATVRVSEQSKYDPHPAMWYIKIRF